MKITSSDTRRVHIAVGYRDDERTENVVWGDVRNVNVMLEVGDVPDMMSAGYRGPKTMFRPAMAHLQWQRNTYWGLSGSTPGWKYPMSENRKLSADKWLLTNAGIRGTNIRKDGSVGKLPECALYANDDGYGIQYHIEPPPWYAELLEKYDPNIHGSPLDVERTGWDR